MKNLKLFFFFLLSSFFFFPFFNTILFLTTSTFTVQSIDNGQLKKFSDHTKGEFINGRHVIINFMFDVEQVEVIKDDKKYTYQTYFLGNAITKLMLKQDRTLIDVDLDKLEGIPRQQFLDLLQNNGFFKYSSGNHSKISKNLEKQVEENLGQKFLDSHRSLLLKTRTLEISNFFYPSSTITSPDLLKFNTFSVAFLRTITWKKLHDSLLFSASSNLGRVCIELKNLLVSFGFEVKTALAFSINEIWTPWLHTLQKVSSLGLTHLTVGKVQVDVSTLVDSKVKEASDLSLEQLQTLKKLESLGLSKLKTQVQTWIDARLDSYKNSIQTILEVFATANVTTIKVDEKLYSIDNLIVNLNKKGSELVGSAKNEFLKLLENDISKKKLTKFYDDLLVYNELLDIFLGLIKTTLQSLVIFKITEFQIDKKNYSIKYLTANLNQKGSAQTGEAKNELLRLITYQIDNKTLTKVLEDAKLDSLLKTIKPTLQVFVSFKITEFQIDKKNYSIKYLTANLNQKGSELVGSAKNELLKLLTHNIGNKALAEVFGNVKLDSFLKVIKSTLYALAAINITEITVNNKSYSISNLTNHLEITGSSQTNQAKIELVALYNYNSDITIIKEKLDNFLMTKRKVFGINIRDVLYDFVAVGVKTINIDNKNYSIAELLKPDNIEKEYSAMSLGSQTEFTNLLAGNIDRNKLILIYKDKLDSFLVDIKPTLQIFAKFKVNQVKINEKIYLIDHLLKDNNLQLIGSAQTGNAKVEFRYLIANNITKFQLDNALVEILKIQEKTKNPIQDLKLKILIIVFSVAAGVLMLFGIIVASVYWFLRTKNSQ